MKIIIFLLTFSCLSCNSQTPHSMSLVLKGIWVPKKIHWPDGDFDTYVFNDSSVVIISSTQKKYRDSILFAVESGFNLKKGKVQSLSDKKSVIAYKTIYRYIELTTEDKNKVHQGSIYYLNDGMNPCIQINGIPYVEDKLYTKESKDRINSIVNKMVPDIEKHPQ